MRTGASEPGKVGDSAVQQPGNSQESSEPSECVLTVEDLSLAVTTSGGETEAKILSEAGEERGPGSSGGERERERTFLPPSERPEAPLVAHYQPSVPVSQVWDREYRISHFERIVYPHSFR